MTRAPLAVLTVLVALVAIACGSPEDAVPTTAAGSAATTTTTSSTAAPTTTSAASTTLPPSTTTTTVSPKVSVSRFDGLSYREVSGEGEASTVDVYVPDGAGGRPAVVLLHGLDLWSEGEADIPLGGFFATEIARLGATVFDFRWDTSGGWSSRSAADLSCIGSFVAARASEYGADPDRIVIVGHSMGAPAGANLAFRSFEVVADADCVETVPNPRAAAVVGIGGAYGVLARPVASAPGTFLASNGLCNTPEPVLREVAASDELAPGLTAEQGYELDGYSSMQLAPSDLQVVLVVGSLDPWHCTVPEVTKAFADALRAEGVDAQVVVLEGRGHEDVVQPFTLGGSLTLQVIDDLLAVV